MVGFLYEVQIQQHLNLKQRKDKEKIATFFFFSFVWQNNLEGSTFNYKYQKNVHKIQRIQRKKPQRRILSSSEITFKNGLIS